MANLVAELAPEAVDPEVRELAERALAVTVDDLGMSALERRLHWFADGDAWEVAASGFVLGWQKAPPQPQRVLGFVGASFGRHLDLFIRAGMGARETLVTVVHECRHSWQTREERPDRPGMTGDQRETDARAYTTAMLARLAPEDAFERRAQAWHQLTDGRIPRERRHAHS